jgi:large subunit ribosomal protein L9
MKIILLKEVETLGQYGDVVDVKKGFARNKLVPQKLAMPCTPSNMKVMEELKKRNSQKEKKHRDEALKFKEQLEKISLTFPIYVGEDGKLFGAVTSLDIEKLLKKEKIDVDKKDITLPEHIKELGVYPVEVRIHSDIAATVKLWVVSEEMK